MMCVRARVCVQLAVRNALRYFPVSVHSTLAAEFLDELRRHGHIYMYRFIPPITIRYTRTVSDISELDGKMMQISI